MKRCLLMCLITITLILPRDGKAAADITACGGVAGISCPQGYFCEYPTPSYPDAQGICREKTGKVLIEQGDLLARSGDQQAAVRYYNEAYTLASQTADPYTTGALADRYLRLRNEQAAMDSYAKAISYGSQWMNRDPGRGQTYAYGLKALQDLVNYYNSTIRMLPATQPTQEWFRARTVEANNLVSAKAYPSGPMQPGPQKDPQRPMPTPVPDPSGHPSGIFCPPGTTLLGGNCVPILPFPQGLPPGK
jgi:hypothetical protein